MNWRRLERDLISVYKYLQESCIGDEARHFAEVPGAITRGSGQKLERKRFTLNTRQHFFTVLVTKRWQRLPRENVESPWRFSEATWVCSWVPCSGYSFLGRVGADGPRGPCQPQLFCDKLKNLLQVTSVLLFQKSRR